MSPARVSAAWSVVVITAIVAAFCLGVLALLPATDRPTLLRNLGGVLAPLVAVIASAVAARVAHTAKQATDAQTPIIQQAADDASTAVRQTNGELTERIHAAVNEALDSRAVVAAPATLAIPAVVSPPLVPADGEG